MDIKFCKPKSGGSCFEPAVGTGIRPVEQCRQHYLEAIAGEIVRAEVVGDVRITDVRTGESVGRGGVVELDPVETNVAALVYCRHVKVLPKPEPVDGGDGGQPAGAKPARQRS